MYSVIFVLILTMIRISISLPLISSYVKWETATSYPCQSTSYKSIEEHVQHAIVSSKDQHTLRIIDEKNSTIYENYYYLYRKPEWWVDDSKQNSIGMICFPTELYNTSQIKEMLDLTITLNEMKDNYKIVINKYKWDPTRFFIDNWEELKCVEYKVIKCGDKEYVAVTFEISKKSAKDWTRSKLWNHNLNSPLYGC